MARQVLSLRVRLPHPIQTCGSLCPICNKLVRLETAKTDEHGLAIHEECYLLKLKLKHASDAEES
jgi:hypothetical protein